MFNIGTGELFVIVLVALLVFGPNKLPEMMRGFGKAMRSFQEETRKATEVLREGLEEPKPKASTAGVIDKPDAAGVPPVVATAISAPPGTDDAAPSAPAPPSTGMEASVVAPPDYAEVEVTDAVRQYEDT
ncbi:MAG TPA: twin-arginine translocase TatA/TatE family subunit [Actinomycetota bacterium]|nr:twin-arginine translocase TatA/TatE family subunit [Actinomycetota bacterium]